MSPAGVGPIRHCRYCPFTTTHAIDFNFSFCSFPEARHIFHLDQPIRPEIRFLPYPIDVII